MITPLRDTRPESRSEATTAAAVPGWVRPARVALLVGLDTAMLAAAAAAAVLFWAVRVHGQPVSLYAGLAPLVLFFLASYARAGLYPGFGVGAVEVLRRLSISTSFVFVVLAAVSFVLKAPALYSRMTFALAWAGSLVLVPAGRLAFLRLMRRVSWWGEPAVLFGGGPLAERTVESLRHALSLGYRPRWVLPGSPDEDGPPSGLTVIRSLEEARAHALRGVRVALVADRDSRRTAQLVERLQPHFQHVIVVRGVNDRPIEGVVVRNMGGVVGLEYRNKLTRWHHRLLKRGLDLALGGTLLLATLPLLALAVVALKLASPGPALFSHEREGLGGRKFRMWKLRTMFLDAERRLAEHLESSGEARAEWERRFKLARDPRVFPGIGRWLRRFSLDELPQLWNVLRGEMSLVGPRPLPDYHLERFSPRFRALRRQVRPGITGLWQVVTRSDGGVEEQETLDTYYIRNGSVWMDLYVLGRTTLAVISGRGAY